MRRISRNRGSITTAVGCLAVIACAGQRAETPAPALLRIPPADSTLIRDITADSVHLRMEEPGYVMVYKIWPRGGWRRLSPEYARPVRYPAGAVAVGVPRQHVSAHLPDASSEPWPSQQMCAAEPQLCSNPRGWVISTPERVQEEGLNDFPGSYLVIVTASLPVLDRLPPYQGISSQPHRASDVPQWLVQQVAALAPVRRWAEY